MLLYSYQKTIMDILKTFGAARVWQLKALVRNHYPKDFRRDKAYIDIRAQIGQLVRYQLLRCEDEIVRLETDVVDFRLLDAIDVMLQITGGTGIQLYRKGEEPVKLTFFREKDGRLFRYDVCFLDGNAEFMSAYFAGLPDEQRKLIFVAPKLETSRPLDLRAEHVYAVPENGEYRFYQ